MIPRARGFIFDLDGVLVDTEPLYMQATEFVVAPFGKTYDWKLKAECMGNPATVTARIIVERLALPLTPEAFLKQREGELLRLFENVREVSGAGAFVSHLATLGVALAVATSSGRELFALKTRHHGWLSHFGVVVCGDDAELARPKPAPDIFLLAARRLSMAAADCIVVEDSPVGVRAALAAGMRVVGLRHPEVAPELFAGVELCVGSYAELEAELGFVAI